MAKRTTKKVNSNELDGQEFFSAIAQIEQEKGIKPGYMMEKITQALVSAYRRDHEGVGDNLIVDANPETNTVSIFYCQTQPGQSRLFVDGSGVKGLGQILHLQLTHGYCSSFLAAMARRF